MIHSVHQAATEHHARLLAEAERARFRQPQGILILKVSLPASKRGGLRIALLRLLLWPSRISELSL